MGDNLKYSILQTVEQKFRLGEVVLVIFEAYQIVGAEHQNRVLVVVKSGNSSALFSFAIANYPPINLSDLHINAVLPINETFIIDNRPGSGISSHQFQILSGNETFTYYYYPDHNKEQFDKVLRKLIQEYSEENHGNFMWLDAYKSSDLSEIDLDIATNKLPPKNRESKFREELERRKPEYTIYEPYKIFCATWNVNLQQPKEDLVLREWLSTTEDAPDIYAIGLQEIDMSAETIIRSETRPDYNWIAKILEGVHPGDAYEELISVRFVGMMLTIVIKQSLRSSVSKITTSMVGTGTLNFGNKGGVGVSLQLNENFLCFINSHLAAHVQEFERRNEDHDEILRRMQFKDGFRTRNILEHDQIFWIGDLNYRIATAIDDGQIKNFCEYEKLFYLDQLYIEHVKKKRVFRDFQEGKITFKPTYKYDPGTDEWDSSEKNRAPAWCDRIFWKGQKVEQLCYKSVMQLRISDHKPVYSVFITYIMTRDEKKFKRVHEEVLKTVDKYENDNQPQMTVAETDLDFGILRYHEMYSRELLVANNCHLPVHFKFLSKDIVSSSVCEDWIRISHKSGELLTGNSMSIRIDIFIDESSASKIMRRLKDAQINVKVPLDILVLHVENGRDIFITVFGEYQPSIFGLRLDTLMKLNKSVLEYSLKELMDIDDDANNLIPFYNNAKAPREIYLMIDYLYRNGLNIPHLFTIQRRHKLSPRICAIRDWLDSWSVENFPGTPQTAAEILLKIFEASPEPLVTITERELQIYVQYFDRCKELVQNKMPLLNRKIFLYVIMFLKEIQKNYTINGMDDRTIAKIFAPALCRHQNDQFSQKFLLLFLSNDIKDFARVELEKN
ncbi:hypothetical protein PVAND_011265 [Polypedilum vanderplanki]|uniref:Rho-GAP domain-containing protein n=1 Tax=Polypedilum vanderplanki TaxID=319348 RepID=A0A9J6CI11_POLVA|nr:hypothetical protein PVAND_011265 [Polypedilum vanderplanki]